MRGHKANFTGPFPGGIPIVFGQKQPEPPDIVVDDGFEPTHDLALIEPMTTYRGEIEVPEQEQNPENKFFVRKVGPGQVMADGGVIPVCCSPGDVIFISPSVPGQPVGIPITVGGRKCLLVRNHQILGAFRSVNRAPSDGAQTAQEPTDGKLEDPQL